MTTITAVIARRYEASQTPGSFIVFDQDRLALSVKSLELPWLDNERSVSCIPAGSYPCERINHPKYGHCWLVKDVPGRDSILVHIGNYAAERGRLKRIMWLIRLFRRFFKIVPREEISSPRKVDTEGCIMPGLQFVDLNGDGHLDIAYSTKAMEQLRAILPDSFKLIII
jgi:hypothetical protein